MKSRSSFSLPDFLTKLAFPTMRKLPSYWPVIVAFALLGALVSFVVLLDYGPDEPFHLKYIDVLATEYRLPTKEETHIVQHAPPYYIAMALPWKLMNVDQRPLSLIPGLEATKAITPRGATARYVLRLLNVLLGCLSIIVIAQILAVLGVPEKRRWLWLGFAAAWPMFGYTAGVVNNENASILFSCAVCLFIVRRVMEGHCSRRDALLLGAFCGLGMLVKQTTLFVVPVALWCVWATAERECRLTNTVGFCAMAALCSIWWPLRNLLVVGDAFPLYTAPPDQNAPSLLSRFEGVPTYIRTISESSFMPDWSWLFFPRELASIAVLGIAVAMFATAFSFRKAPKTPENARRKTVRRMAVLAFAFLFLGILQSAIFKDRAAQMGGRYLLNGLPWLLAFFAAALPLRDEQVVATSVESSDEEAVLDTATPVATSNRVAVIPVLIGLLVVLALIDLGWWFIVWTHYGAVLSGTWQAPA